ncbi:MAG: hypothetical protein LIV28_05810 [Lactobacillus sp.]|nr:hypothetical protein [Lactobacillus sp.]
MPRKGCRRLLQLPRGI